MPRRFRQVCVLGLVWATLTTVTGPAVAATGSDDRPDAGQQEEIALSLLERAVHAGRSATYSGTQYVASWSHGSSSSMLAEVAHDPERGAVVRVPAAPPHRAAPEGPERQGQLDHRLLHALAAGYTLAVTDRGRCTGRSAHVLEARRTGTRGAGAVAARFWLDVDSGLVLRRDVYDATGRRVRSSAYLDLVVTPQTAPVPGSPAPAAPAPWLRVAEELRSTGWPVPEQLPGGFTLFDVRQSGRTEGADSPAMVHLAYSDGLATVSLFVQRGALGQGPRGGFSPQRMAGAPVWVHADTPQRVVWSGGQRVWTLVSDAPADTVQAAVAALPHDPPTAGGVRARLDRGLRRLGGLLNPLS